LGRLSAVQAQACVLLSFLHLFYLVIWLHVEFGGKGLFRSRSGPKTCKPFYYLFVYLCFKIAMYECKLVQSAVLFGCSVSVHVLYITGSLIKYLLYVARLIN
jgi:hypothetical protein